MPKLGSRFVIGFVACCLALLAPSVASAQVGVSVTPALYPAFDPAVHDYVTRCAGTDVQVDVSGDPARRVGVDGDAPRGGSFTRAVALSSSQTFSFTLADTGGSVLDSYRVRCLPSDFPGFTSARTGPTQASWYIVTPTQSLSGPPPAGTSNQYAAIFDSEGVPVWWFKTPSGFPVDAKLLSDGNLGWSLSNGGPGGMEERTLSGQVVRALNTVGIGSDVHEMQLLPNGHYLLVAYHQKPGYDLTAIGGTNPAAIIDAEIQEIDPADGSVVWQWDASDHIDFSQTAPRWRAVVLAPSMFGTNDVYHLNSVEPDGDGYIVSLRATDAVYRINKSDGSIDWKLGGTNLPGKSLTVLGDPKVDPDGPLAGQHDARLLPDGDLTIHDNGGYYSNGLYVGRPPRAVRFHIDAAAKTATWVSQVTDSLAPASLCCGSARLLPGGNWVTDWGGGPIVTELTGDGSRVFKLKFDAPLFSYRADPVTAGELTSPALQTGMNAQHPRTGLTLSGASGSFGGATVGTHSGPQTFTVSNSGQGPVQIAETGLTGSDAGQYSVSGCGAQTLAAGASCAATVTFTPSSTGAHNAATLSVSSDGASGPNVAPLTGTGAAAGAPVPPPPIIKPPSSLFAFPKLKVGRTGTVTVHVSLPGAGQLAALETTRSSALSHAGLKAGHRELVIARSSKAAKRSGKVTISLRLNKLGRARLRAHHGSMRARLMLRFKPTGGSSRTKSKTFTLTATGL